MKPARPSKNVTKRFFRPEIQCCLEGQTRFRPNATLSRRTIIRRDGVVRVTHRGSRCPTPSCPTRQRGSRSAAAAALALPGFTFGLAIVGAVAQQRLAGHQPLDEVLQHLQEPLAPLGVSISRREVLDVFEAYAPLLRAAKPN